MKKLTVKKPLDVTVIDLDKVPDKKHIKELLSNGYSIEVRASGEFTGKAIYLTDDYNWELGKDTEGVTILVPIIK